MMKYRANSTFCEIDLVEIIKETDSSVYTASAWSKQGDRHAKLSESRGYFDTFDEARRFLLESEEGKIAALTRELARRQEKVAQIRAMQEPKA